MPPRYLVRRSLAFAIDHTLALALIFLLLLPFVGQGVRLPEPVFGLKTYACRALDTPPEWLPADASGAQFSALRLCENRLLGLPNGRDLIAVYAATQPDSGIRVTRSLRIALTADGQPSHFPDLAGLLVFVVLGVASGVLTRLGRASPGKALLGLRLEGPLPRGFAREALRLGPIALVSALPTLAPVPLLLGPVPVVVGLVALVALAMIWAYLWPLLHWNGQMRYDRWTGFYLRLKA